MKCISKTEWWKMFCFCGQKKNLAYICPRTLPRYTLPTQYTMTATAQKADLCWRAAGFLSPPEDFSPVSCLSVRGRHVGFRDEIVVLPGRCCPSTVYITSETINAFCCLYCQSQTHRCWSLCSDMCPLVSPPRLPQIDRWCHGDMKYLTVDYMDA